MVAFSPPKWVFRTLVLKNVRKGYRENLSFLVVWKKQSSRHGWEMVKKKKSKKFLDFFLLLFRTISSPCLGLFFFQITQNYMFSLYSFLTFFSTRVLETHLGGIKAACIGPALSKFCPSVGDGQLLSPLPYFITGSWAEDWSLIPFIGTWTEVWTLPFPTPSRSHLVSSYSAFISVSFSCWWIFSIISVGLYGLVIIVDKCHNY